MIDRQQIFTNAVNGIRRQGTYAGSIDRACMYRGPNGTACAIGHNIPDDRYRPGIEGSLATSPTVHDAMGLTDIPDDDIAFLQELQACLHDNIVSWSINRKASDAATRFMAKFEEEVISFAADHDLEVPARV
jgi:hypothetical protein